MTSRPAHASRRGVGKGRWDRSAGSADRRSLVAGDGGPLNVGSAAGRRAGSGRAGPGVVDLAGYPLGGWSGAGRPARPQASDAALWSAGLPEGYTLEPADGDGWRLFHECGNWVAVDKVSELRLRLRIRRHRCGPPGSEWHEGVPKHRRKRRNLRRPADVARRRGQRGRVSGGGA